jgi:DNA ligase-1
MTLFANLAALSETLAEENSRLKKRAEIAATLGAIVGMPAPRNRDMGQPDSLHMHAQHDAGLFCLYLAGQPFPEADPRKLNAGGALLTRVLKQISGCTDAALTAAYRRHGDLGAAAFDLLTAAKEQKPTLTLDEVAATFDAMAAARVTTMRAAQVERLLRQATALEAKYLLKLMLGDMRIGVKQSLIEEAIAVAAGADVVAVRHAVMLEADLSQAVGMAFAGTLAEARMRLFHPLGFMLASPVETPEEAIARFTEKTVKVEKPKKKKLSRRKKKDLEASEEFVDLGRVQGIEPEDAAEVGLVEDVAAEVVAAQPGSENPEARHSALVVEAFLEDKYDGMRAQVHCGDPAQPGRVAIYSRNREDITQSFPEIEEAFRDVKEPLSGPLILDGELLGWDLVESKALPFSVLGQRIGRKRVDNRMRRQVPVVFVIFDLLFQDGELLLPLPLRERRARLESVVARLSAKTVSPIECNERVDAAQAGLFAAFEETKEPPIQRLMLSPAKLVESAEAIDRAYADARARANEGVMLKAAGSAYLPGRRGLAWVKLKRELATLDVVITGAEFGHGRRAGLLSDYTFAVRGGGDGGELLNVGKAYSGVTDAEIAELTEWLKAHTLEDYGHFRTVEPLRVIEVSFNNIMRSDRHASGFALRFPRILRIRDDKPLGEIDTLERVEEIYQLQPDKGVD